MVTNIARISQCKSVSPLFITSTGFIISDWSLRLKVSTNQKSSSQPWINVSNPNRNFINISNIFFGVFEGFECVNFETCKNSNPSCRLRKVFCKLLSTNQSVSLVDQLENRTWFRPFSRISTVSSFWIVGTRSPEAIWTL